MSPLINSSAGRRRARSAQGRLPAGPLQGSAWKFRVDCFNLHVVRVDYTPARSREFTYKESIHFFRLNRDIAAPRRRVSWFVWVFRVGFCAGVGPHPRRKVPHLSFIGPQDVRSGCAASGEAVLMTGGRVDMVSMFFFGALFSEISGNV